MLYKPRSLDSPFKMNTLFEQNGTEPMLMYLLAVWPQLMYSKAASWHSVPEMPVLISRPWEKDTIRWWKSIVKTKFSSWEVTEEGD